jgi:serine/threonine protein kinase
MQFVDGRELAPIDVFVDLKNEKLLSKFASLELVQSKLDMQKELGKGQFGSVLLATLQNEDGSKIDVAVKMLHQQGVPEAEMKQFEYEARLLVALEHPHIIRAIGVCFETMPQLLVIELMGGGDLKKYLTENVSNLAAEPRLLGGACVQIADAMEYLERKRVVHRDLAARFFSDSSLLYFFHQFTETFLSDLMGLRLSS